MAAILTTRSPVRGGRRLVRGEAAPNPKTGKRERTALYGKCTPRSFDTLQDARTWRAQTGCGGIVVSNVPEQTSEHGDLP
ncbi:hypothetical protein AB0D34_06925 [Streptomyces sp. NPDC048420]|uniref:hypothetical protein n=1 Tax=Streptomyces sp. NPDC048420 TaxID=3155755 RepID=UPI00343CCE86